MAAEKIPVHQQIELAEAVIELAMARHAEISPRGFDSQAQRAKIHAQIDSMFDHLAILRLEALLDTNSSTPRPPTP